jgi:YesN/AraC family two-component response regulator
LLLKSITNSTSCDIISLDNIFADNNGIKKYYFTFCKCIKKKTKKSFSEIVNEIRLSHATKLLIDTDKTVGEIYYESGFSDHSYFYKVFKKVMCQTPRQFRDKYVDQKEMVSTPALSKHTVL